MKHCKLSFRISTPLLLLLAAAFSAQADELRISKGKVTLDFATSAENHTGPYSIQRSLGRFGQKEMLVRPQSRYIRIRPESRLPVCTII